MKKLSPDQQKNLENLIDWYTSKKRKSFITLGGYAGTGKTTLISHLAQKLHKNNKKLAVSFCSYTGKATRVLKNKLHEKYKQAKKNQESPIVTTKDSISTIHSLIYTPIVDSQDQIIGWDKKEKLNTDLIIIDEASMVDNKIWKDLLSYKIPIIAVGDHGQLPPIKGKFNLMENPNLKLEKIHRQAKGNPIIKYSILAREEGKVPVGTKSSPSGKVTKISQTDPYAQNEMENKIGDYTNDTMILCGYNNTRTRLNKFIREAQGFTTPEPQRNDRVICLRNNYEKNIFNGMLGTIREIREEDEKWYKALIEMDDEKNMYDGYISREQFNNPQSLNFTEQRSKTVHGDLFDFGYALTVHKAQGSQSPKVILFEQRFKNMDDEMWKKWLYTGITRAENELFIIGE